MELIKHNGFSYATVIIYWVKTKNKKLHQLPSKFSNSSIELLLVATKGKIDKFLTET